MSWLQEKYIKLISPRLSLFKQKKKGLYNCRCPICGDSQKSKTKARGYFYDRKGQIFYNCKNCGASTTFAKFLEDFDSELYKEYKMEEFKESASHRVKRVKKSIKFSYDAPKESNKQLDFLDSCDILPHNHKAKIYLEQRKVPANQWDRIYYADNMNIVAKELGGYEHTKFDDYPRIIFPFINEDNVLTHVQGRSIDENTPKQYRYVTLEIVKDAPKIFGLDSINRNELIRVVEGPIDSLFLNNCIAVAGSALHMTAKLINMEPSNILIVTDREPRNKEIVKIVEKSINAGYKVSMLPDNITGKDINDYVIAGYEPNYLIDNNIFSDLVARVQFGHWKKI